MRGIRNIGDENGQALTEFAIVLPLLFVILFALVQAGITLNHYLTLTDAVRAGARAASVNASLGSGPATDAATQAMQKAADDVPLLDPRVDSDWGVGDPVTVSASVPWSISLFGVTVLSGNLTSQTTQRAE